jgi:RNA polymerase sigma factor (sigma-70 family)
MPLHPQELTYSSMSLEELIRACAESGDPAAWEEFVQRFHNLIAAVVLRTARRWGKVNSSLIDDLVQEAYLRLCRDRGRLFAEFRPHHPEAFHGYLSVVTANVVRDHFRALHSQKRGSGESEDSIEQHSTAVQVRKTGTAQQIERSLLLKDMDWVLCSSLPAGDRKRDRSIFWLYYRYGLSAPAIARLPSVALTVKGVESVIHRLTRLVREELSERPGTRAPQLGKRTPANFTLLEHS